MDVFVLMKIMYGFVTELVRNPAIGEERKFLVYRGKITHYGTMGDQEIFTLLGLISVFTRGQFWPSGIVVACVCLCVRPSVCAVITCLSAR